MKKLIYGITLLGLIACKKEKVQEELEIQKDNINLTEEAINQKEFKYNYEVTLKGDEKKHYVKYTVSSNNNEAAMSMVQELESSSLKLLTDKKSITQSPPINKVESTLDYQEIPYDFEKGVHLVEVERNIGKFAGYGVEKSVITNKNQYLNSHSTITITTTGGGIYVRNLWVYPNYNYHFFKNGSSWTLDRLETLSYYQDYTFTGGGYSEHHMVINPSYINGAFQYNNKIYWTVWPS